MYKIWGCYSFHNGILSQLKLLLLWIQAPVLMCNSETKLVILHVQCYQIRFWCQCSRMLVWSPDNINCTVKWNVIRLIGNEIYSFSKPFFIFFLLVLVQHYYTMHNFTNFCLKKKPNQLTFEAQCYRKTIQVQDECFQPLFKYIFYIKIWLKIIIINNCNYNLKGIIDYYNFCHNRAALVKYHVYIYLYIYIYILVVGRYRR